jgi:transposase
MARALGNYAGQRITTPQHRNCGRTPLQCWLTDEAPVAGPDRIYTNRNKVERLRARLKEGRAVATRYEKTARSFMGVLCLAAALNRLKR